MESEDSDVCLTTSRGVHASPHNAGAVQNRRHHEEAESAVIGFTGYDDLPVHRDARHSPDCRSGTHFSRDETRQVQQHQSPRREFLLRQSQSEASRSTDIPDENFSRPGFTYTSAHLHGNLQTGLKQWHTSKQSQV